LKTPFKILTLFFTLISVSWARNAPITCNIKSYDGHYLTAVDSGGRGGRVRDVLNTNRTQASARERFTIIDTGEGSGLVGIQNFKGYYLSAQGGGGRIFDVIQYRTQLLDWEKFRLISLGGNSYAIQTFSGNYLTAVDSGGRTTNVIHSDATRIGTWEMWTFICGIP
jgi:hypothetical protein